MKPMAITDVGRLKNELNKYKKGKKLDIRHFNQAARLAWLGKITLAPLDPQDPQCQAYLLHLAYPEGLDAHLIDLDEDLMSQIHVLDGEQARYLAEILKQGVEDRAGELSRLARRDFYLEKFFRSEASGPPENGGG